MSPVPPIAASLILLAKYREKPAKNHRFGNNPRKSTGTVPFLIQFINATTGGTVNLHVSKVRLIFTPSLSNPFLALQTLRLVSRSLFDKESWIWIRIKVGKQDPDPQ
jgi:hypothetical protein